MERAVNSIVVEKLWDIYQLPVSMKGKTFLDVGCWGGQFCVEALNRGAVQAVGVDSVHSSNMDRVEASGNVSFMLMDVFSPHFLTLPRFDVVLCAGVLYHVPTPVDLLLRLKAVVADGGKLYLETAVGEGNGFVFQNNDDFDGNFSNWFIPDITTLGLLMGSLGFSLGDCDFVDAGRAIFTAYVTELELPKKFLPRKTEYMEK